MYHTDTPMGTSSKVFKEQLEVVLKILETLYKTKHKPTDSTSYETRSISAIMGKDVLEPEITTETLEENFQRRIRVVQTKTQNHWRRIKGEWRIVSGISGPEKVMVSLLRSYPNCKTTQEISSETNCIRSLSPLTITTG